jgi:two-component system phosphate regulon response regulator PhoB
MRSILIVEDDASTAESLELYLRAGGYAVTVARDGVSGLAEARSGRHALVLLDLMLPGMYGLDVCRELRRESALPVIMLTARTLEDDQVRGLDLGADDYITKPFSPRQVVARIRSVLRRHDGTSDEVLRAGALEVDLAAARATVGGHDAALTPTELRILHALMRARGRVLAREDLLGGGDRNVDVHIKNLRRKLGPDGARIETVFGLGYRFS